MSAAFAIEIDPSRDLVRIRMSGFFDHASIAAFVVDLRAAHRKLRCGPNRFVTVNDIRDMKIQSQDIVAAFQAMLGDPAIRSRRLAFVVSSTLARMQLMRVISDRTAQCFTDAADAEAWLLDADSDQAPPLNHPRPRTPPAPARAP